MEGKSSIYLDKLIFAHDVVPLVTRYEGKVALRRVTATAGSAKHDRILSFVAIVHDLEPEGFLAFFLPEASEIFCGIQKAGMFLRCYEVPEITPSIIISSLILRTGASRASIS